MDDHLLEEVSTRLDADPDLDLDVRHLIDAALLDELDAEACKARRTPPRSPVVETPSERVYVGSVSVAGFRGVGPESRLSLNPGPGLTLVVGRNGSGKSSFAEGLELLLTGDNQRWSSRKAKEWRSGFRNVHVSAAVRLEAELLIEGAKASRARRSWGKDDELGNGAFSLTVNGTTHSSLSAVGWDQPLQAYRPFLSYNEVGSILDKGPSTLFDSLNPILGLAELNDAADRLKAQQNELKGAAKEVKASLKEIRAKLGELDDERAKAAGKALAGYKWKLDDAASLIQQGAGEDGECQARLPSSVVGTEPRDHRCYCGSVEKHPRTAACSCCVSRPLAQLVPLPLAQLAQI